MLGLSATQSVNKKGGDCLNSKAALHLDLLCSQAHTMLCPNFNLENYCCTQFGKCKLVQSRQQNTMRKDGGRETEVDCGLGV